MTRDLPTLEEAKRQARQIRAEATNAGENIGHAHALERVAKRYGCRDWNTLHAAIKDAPPENWRVGARVKGEYLSQPFSARVVAIEKRQPGWFAIELDLDDPIDVVRFDSFSNLRKRIKAVVGPKGHSFERTSDGAPHLRLD